MEREKQENELRDIILDHITRNRECDPHSLDDKDIYDIIKKIFERYHLLDKARTRVKIGRPHCGMCKTGLYCERNQNCPRGTIYFQEGKGER